MQKHQMITVFWVLLALFGLTLVFVGSGIGRGIFRPAEQSSIAGVDGEYPQTPGSDEVVKTESEPEPEEAPQLESGTGLTLSDELIYACDLLNESEAEEILGPNLKIFREDKVKTSTDDIRISKCTYMTKPKDPEDIRTASVEIRHGLTQAGRAHNIKMFESYRNSRTVDITGLGFDANYNYSINLLNGLWQGDLIRVSYCYTQPECANFNATIRVAKKL